MQYRNSANSKFVLSALLKHKKKKKKKKKKSNKELKTLKQKPIFCVQFINKLNKNNICCDAPMLTV